MSSNYKMSWFVDKYNSNSLEYIIKNTSADFGTIIMPTGTGKSGVVYEDIIHLINTKKSKRKLIINISCPILKLTQQFINDLFSVIYHIYNDNKKICFYINSSDSGQNYQNDNTQPLGININKFSKIINFINSDIYDIAIVASCHKSLYKFNQKLTKLQNVNIDIINYIDEAHLIDIRKNNDDENIVYFDIDKLCKYSTKVYALTATPDPDVTMAINKYNLKLSGTILPIYKLSAIDAIHNNIILPPYVKYILKNCDTITDKINTLVSIMKDAKLSNSNIYHKILVTLQTSEELKQLRIELEKQSYKVFSTCSQYGYNTNIEDDPEYADVTGFIKDVENYNGDCFVLHIRQLIQGIDIKSLTDCVIWSADSGNQRHYRHTIQIIGRTLRFADGERGLSYNDPNRKKKVGQVYFISPSDAAKVQDNISQFICRYYGFDNITFETAKSYKTNAIGKENNLFDEFFGYKINMNNNSNSPIIKEILINIENYIKTQFKPWMKFYMSINKKIDLDAEIKNNIMKYDTFSATLDKNTIELLDNRDLVNAIKKLFEKYNIIQGLF